MAAVVGSVQQSAPQNGSIRESIEALEDQALHPLAARSATSQGRERPESPCSYRTMYQRDRDRIIHSKAFRRLKDKTQVFIAPVGDHYRTRLTHSLEVAQVARTIARALRLNEDLTESIALGHDLGHPPFGHQGEHILNELHPEGFHHQRQSVRVVSLLEPLNLSREAMAGIGGGPLWTTLEAQVVDLADRVAYLHHDVEDARRAGLMEEADLPAHVLARLGHSRQERLAAMVTDCIETSLEALAGLPGEAETVLPLPRLVRLSEPMHTAVLALRQWMFDHVYLVEDRLKEAQRIRRVLSGLYQYLLDHPEAMPEKPTSVKTTGRHQAVLDFVAGMTDRFAIDAYKKWLLPNPYHSAEVDALSALPVDPDREWL
ncbi:MAG: deoxyguanosinetriphosphate triphosphohydrolase [Candidatus Melainabacteria bacterium]